MMKNDINAQISFLDEIIVDNFAGGGGASTGIELACGKPVTIAINHDPDAIAMHMANHPYTEHYQESVWGIDPVEICKGRKVGLAWFSPDCKHFSRAKGGKPVSKNIRSLAWVAVKWAATVKPRVIMLENVPEFQTWCRIGKDGQPDFKHKGETFRSFVHALQHLGYEVKWQELKACDYGAPTIRKRFFLVARCDGQPIVFPNPTHGESKGLQPYHTAAECIDWSVPCKSIFGRSKPLAENTMKRIARGLDKFTIKANKPFIVTCNHGGDGFRGQDTDVPLNTVTQKCTDGIVIPQLNPYVMSNNTNNVGKACSEPVPTVTTGNRNFLCSPHISKYFSGVTGSNISEPLPTVTAIDHNSLVAPSLIQYHTETSKSEVRGQALNEPIMTVDGSPRYALASAHIVKYYSGDDNYSSVKDPLHTITTKERNALVESHLCILRHNEDGRPLTEPLPTVTTSGAHFAEVRTKIVKYCAGTSVENWAEVRKMLNSYCGYTFADDEILLLIINGTEYFIADIGMRMLEPRELYKAQGFPPDYIIDKDFNGKEYPRSKQVARCGNAVPPPFAEALVRANLPEWCNDKITTMKEFSERAAV
jgi:DNA (cytosine-5)-methyltransferase 1